MPEKGWKNLPVRDAIYDALEKRAKKENNAVARVAEKILADGLGLKLEELREP